MKAYRLIGKSTKQIIISLDVIFDENTLNILHASLDYQNKKAEVDNPNGLLAGIFKPITTLFPSFAKQYLNNLNIGIPNLMGLLADPPNQQSIMSQPNLYGGSFSFLMILITPFLKNFQVYLFMMKMLTQIMWLQIPINQGKVQLHANESI